MKAKPLALRSQCRFVALALSALLALGSAAAADQGNGISLLRDSEIETDIHQMMSPVWKVAGLDPAEVHVYLVNDRRINSFVAGGQNIFINAGLLLKAKTPNQLIGVLAHETGHIAGGHLLLSREAMHNAGIEGIIAMVLGAAASIAGGNGAAMLPAASVAQQSYLHFSVAAESTADQAALRYLDATCQSARGLLQFFEIMENEELLSGAHEDPYLMDHPLTEERIRYVRDHVARARCSNTPDTPTNIALFKRMKVKLAAFLDDPQTTLANYPPSDHSVLARYARAIAYYRIPELDRALPIIDGLIKDYPRDPYFEELKGQMLFENGHVQAAVQPYEAAVRLDPSAALLRISLGQVYIETHNPSLDKRAIAYLNDASRSEGQSTLVWHLLATAYGRDGQMGMAALSLAEEGLAAGKKKDALMESSQAERLLAKNTPAYFRAQDIQREAKDLDND